MQCSFHSRRFTFLYSGVTADFFSFPSRGRNISTNQVELFLLAGVNERCDWRLRTLKGPALHFFLYLSFSVMDTYSLVQ